MIPQIGEIWTYESQSDMYNEIETWLILDDVPLNKNIDARCYKAYCFEINDIDHIYYSETTCYYWRRLA